jgi:hypothetical protein
MHLRRVLPAVSAIALVAAMAAPAYAAKPSTSGGGTHGGGGGGGKHGSGGTTSSTPLTYDVSYPQCGRTLPSPIQGAIVGVNDGIVFSANPCLGAEYDWAITGTDAPALYANTANPGPGVSSHWPTGQQQPKVCDGSNSVECSYDYGWNAAQDSFADAVAAIPAGVPPLATWWLDVETGNSWESLESQFGANETSYANDRASLQGAVDALTARGVKTVGFYSTSYQWGQITGGTGTQFAGNPAWVAGVGSLSTAQANCTTTSFTGGPIVWAQYADSNLDADYRC